LSHHNFASAHQLLARAIISPNGPSLPQLGLIHQNQDDCSGSLNTSRLERLSKGSLCQRSGLTVSVSGMIAMTRRFPITKSNVTGMVLIADLLRTEFDRFTFPRGAISRYILLRYVLPSIEDLNSASRAISYEDFDLRSETCQTLGQVFVAVPRVFGRAYGRLERNPHATSELSKLHVPY
jgi:hypothetical protein